MNELLAADAIGLSAAGVLARGVVALNGVEP
jgi:hypothetical protein